MRLPAVGDGVYSSPCDVSARYAREAVRPHWASDRGRRHPGHRSPHTSAGAEAMTYGVSRALVEFVHRYLRTMDHVEIVLYLHRAAEPRSITAIASETRLSEPRTKAVVHQLVGAGLIVASGAQFAWTHSSEVEGVVGELADAYNSRPVALVRAIYSRPTAIQSLADAFRLRRDKEGDDQ